MGEAYVIEACRTPRGVGKLGKGALSHLHPSYLGSTVLKEPAEHNELDTSQVDDVIWGTSAQVDKQGCDLGRIAALNAGYDVRTSGVTLDRFCGSGITAVSLAAAQIRSGFEDCIVAGGTKMMSFTGSLSLPPLLDARNENLTKLHPQSQQGVCADAIATLEGISREGVDALAVESQKRAARAFDEGRFDRSLIVVRNPDGSVALEREEFPRPQTTLQTLAGLRTAFDKVRDIVVDEVAGPASNVGRGVRYETRDEWAQAFDDVDACVTPVLDYLEAPSHPHNSARRSHVAAGPLVHPHPALRFVSDEDWRPTEMRPRGEGREAILSEAGFAEADIGRLTASGALPRL